MAVASLFSGASQAFAQNTYNGGGDLPTLAFGVGYYDVFDNDDEAADFRLEYRSGTKLFWEIKPWVGLEATNDGSIFAGGGVFADFTVAPNIYLTPLVGVALYGEGDSNKDLGSVLEFKTQIEAGYEFDNGNKLGVALSHISNAGIDDDNPGTEVLGVYYHLPIGMLF